MSVSATAASGMYTAALRQQVAASNVAGSGSADSQRLGVLSNTQAGAGVSATVVGVGQDSAAPVTDMVNSLQASNSFEANAAVLETYDEMLGSLLDTYA